MNYLLPQFPGVQLERRLICGAEEMNEVQDESVDVVVATGVFCNIPDVQKALREIIRTLVPVSTEYMYSNQARPSICRSLVI